MSKPFNFEEFKAGKPAIERNIKLIFIETQEDLTFPIVCKAENDDSQTWICSYMLQELVDNFTMLPTKRTVWIAIIKENQNGRIMPSSHLYDSKEQALQYRAAMWKVIDAIPYEIEE